MVKAEIEGLKNKLRSRVDKGCDFVLFIQSWFFFQTLMMFRRFPSNSMHDVSASFYRPFSKAERKMVLGKITQVRVGDSRWVNWKKGEKGENA
jgi:hypothetical protein